MREIHALVYLIRFIGPAWQAACSLLLSETTMKTLHFLLGSSEPRISNLIEVLIRDVCYNRALANCIRAARISDFLRLGGSDAFDLILVDPSGLLPGPNQRGARIPMPEMVRTIQTIRRQCVTPIIAISVAAQHEAALLEAGVEAVLGLPFHCEAVKVAVRDVLRIGEAVQESETSRWSLGEALVRGWHRLKQA